MRAIFFLSLAAAVMFLACGDGDDSSDEDCLPPTPPRFPTGTVPTASAEDTPLAYCGVTPPRGAVEPTPTLDLHSTIPPDEARGQLLQVRGVAEVLWAVENGDAEAILALVDWEQQSCGLPRGYTDRCPAGVAAYTKVPMLDVGSSVPLWLTEASLQIPLREVLSEPLDISVAWSRSIAGTQRQLYYVGLQGAPRPVSPSFIWGDSDAVSGLLLVLLSDSAHPILKVAFVIGDSIFPLAESVIQPGDTIITYNP